MLEHSELECGGGAWSRTQVAQWAAESAGSVFQLAHRIAVGVKFTVALHRRTGLRSGPSFETVRVVVAVPCREESRVAFWEPVFMLWV